MSRKSSGLLKLKWTASKKDLKHPETLLLSALIASATLPILLSGEAISGDAEFPPILSAILFAVFFMLVPVLCWREKTEVLFDGTKLALAVTLIGFLLFTVAFWTTPGQESIYNHPFRTVSFAITAAGFYGLVMLGVTWMINFWRKGVEGVETGFD